MTFAVTMPAFSWAVSSFNRCNNMKLPPILKPAT